MNLPAAVLLALLVSGCALERPELVLTGTVHGNPPVFEFEHIHHHRLNPTPWWDHFRTWLELVFAF